MTELEKEINNTKATIEQGKAAEARLLLLQKMTQPTDIEVLDNTKDFFDLNIYNDYYEEILGGDGRSSPWSKKTFGTIGRVTIKKQFYLSRHQKDIIKRYIKDGYKNINHIEIRNY